MNDDNWLYVGYKACESSALFGGQPDVAPRYESKQSEYPSPSVTDEAAVLLLPRVFEAATTHLCPELDPN